MDERCPICDDDGYVEYWTDDDYPVTYDCPRINTIGHAPFNATGILDPVASPRKES